jgi:hypothetical protein
MLFHIEVVHLNGPALLIDAQDLLCGQGKVRAQKILRVCIPRMPFADQHTDVKRQMLQSPLAGAYQVRALSPVCSGQLYTLIPLMLERLGPLGKLLVSELAIGLDRTDHMPPPATAEGQQAIGSIPTVKEHVDLKPRRQALG